MDEGESRDPLWEISHLLLQGLEDKFDGHNRMNLRHLIMAHVEEEPEPLRVGQGHPAESEATPTIESEGDQEPEEKQDLDKPTTPSYYIVDQDRDGSKRIKELARIPTCAVFHNYTSGKGVPHSFVGKRPSCILHAQSFDVLVRFHSSMARSAKGGRKW